ncbi:MAG: GTPase/DUF3482 domain-containing protein [Pseudomonadota bacterium]|nr:GTPase/DUF3482 domain-containing protein [Pseudomonadota bacterium]
MQPLALAVVGHTNTGKTSLLRTLLRDVAFGEVKNQASTTRHVERAAIRDQDQVLLWLYDTPGLEDAGAVLDWLDAQTSSRQDGIERIQAFLRSAEAEQALSQEAKVLRQLLSSDVALYVIDAREPVLGRYKDELQVLSLCAKPIMAVFNFAANQAAAVSEWREMLARRGLHVSVCFDSVAFDFDSELLLWRDLSTLVTHQQVLEQLIDARQDDWHVLYEQALQLVAHFLLDIAAYQRVIHVDDDPVPVLASMQEQVRQLERQLQEDLLNLYRFYDNQVQPVRLDIPYYQQDPFDPELLKAYGLRTTSGAAAGAAVGLGIDAMALGTTLGLGTALGAALGGVGPNARSIRDKLTGQQRLLLNPETLTLLAARSMALLQHLRQRGHASQSNIEVSAAQLPWNVEQLPSSLKKARGRVDWSALNTQQPNQSRLLREDQVPYLVGALRQDAGLPTELP